MKNKTMAQVIKSEREKTGLTQTQLAKFLGISAAAITSYETGKRQPNSFVMAKLENFFGVTGEYLRGDTIDIERPDNKDIVFNGLFDILKKNMSQADEKTKDAILSLLKGNVDIISSDEIMSKVVTLKQDHLITAYELIKKYVLLSNQSKDKLLERSDELLIIDASK